MRITKSVPVPDELRRRITTETSFIDDYVKTGERWEAHKEPRASLEARLDAARRSGLFYPGISSALQISNPLILAAQAEIARVHGLHYLEDGRRSMWQKARESDLAGAALRGRTDNYLQRIIHASEDKHIPKTDFGLLAHCFQMPLRCWEASTYSAFEDYLDLATKVDLFAQGLDFLDFFQSPSTGIEVRELPLAERTVPDFKQPELRVVRTRTKAKRVQSNKDLLFYLKVPESLGNDRVFAILIEQDDDGVVSLLSTETLVDREPWFSETVQIPRQSVIERNDYGVSLGSRGTSTLYCVVSKADLGPLPLYLRSTGSGPMEASTVVSQHDLALLRDALLRMPPSDWAVVRTIVAVE